MILWMDRPGSRVAHHRCWSLAIARRTPETRSPPSSPTMFAGVGRGAVGAAGGAGSSLRVLVLFLVVAVCVVALERWWTGPPPIRPVAVQLMPSEAAAAADDVEALGGLVPLPEEDEP